MSKQEEARRTELRLKPDVTALHRHMFSLSHFFVCTMLTTMYRLHWNYDHTGTEPPDVHPQFAKVPDSFPLNNALEVYSKVFEPLILLETWSALIRSKGEEIATFEAEVSGRRRTDNWLDLDVTVLEAIPFGWYLTENDIVLLREANGSKSILCKVGSSKLAPGGLTATLRCSPFTSALMSLDNLLMIRSCTPRVGIL